MDEPERHEWLIVSRWGDHGDMLSIARTFVAADTLEAPIELTPRQTALGTLLPLPDAPSVFLLARALPESTRLAGQFVPAEGHIRLTGQDSTLELVIEGRCANPDCPRAPWRAEATRCPWIGEFFDPAPAPG